MDPLSQGVAGALFAQSCAKRETLRQASFFGFCGGLVADLDVLIRSAHDPLLAIEYHRHFTHSIFFIPFGGLILSLFFWLFPICRRNIPFKHLYGFCTAGYATSGLLDACTSYGTQLWWPFSSERVAWNNIAIIDPVFTFGIIAFIGFALLKKSPTIARIGLAFALTYLIAGEVQNKRAESIVRHLAESRGHLSPSRITAKPSPFSLLLWRGIYLYQDSYYVDAIRLNYGKGYIIYPGDSTPRFDPESLTASIPKNSQAYKDLLRFAHFSDDYLYQDPNREFIIGDLRYSLLPNSIEPLWGIKLNPTQPNQHLPFINFRTIDETSKSQFISMLKGLPPESLPSPITETLSD